jgi:hypothetical protein
MENPNEKTNPEREFEVCIEYRLNRIEKITSSAYKEGYDEETGSRFIDASGVDLKKEYEKEHMTPLEIQEAFLEFIPFLMNHYLDEWRKENDKAKSAALWDKVNKIQSVWESLGGWEEEFIEAWEV